MEVIPREAGDSVLSNAIHNNLLDYFRLFGRNPRIEFREVDGIVRWRTRVPHPWFNGVISERLPRGNETAFIQDNIAYFHSRNVGVFTWWLEPEQKGVGWEEILLNQGLRPDANTPGMAMSLDQLPPSPTVPAGLQIRPVEDLPGLKTWCSVFIRGYEIPGSVEEPFYDLVSGIGLDFPTRYYTGYLNERPVAASQLLLSSGVAGIYCVATLPEARGRGVGAALTLAPLQDALQAGYHHGILQSSEMGYNVYRRLGFTRLCDIEHFYWTQ